MDQVRTLLEQNYSIKWVGYHSPLKVWVYMHKVDTPEKKLVIDLKEDYTESNFKSIRSSFADYPLSSTGTIWSSSTRLDILRLAAVIGLNVGGDATPGNNKDFKGHTGCIMAYDIESDRSRIPLSSFGTFSETILSIATYCSCGEYRVFSLIPGVDFDYIQCENSPDTVRQFLYYVQKHCPQWLVGYNNFGYDNARIMYHSPEEFDPILIRMKVGIGSSRSYACYIDVQGTYNIDLLTWLDKTARSNYPNMSLKTVAQTEKIAQKMEFDTANITDFKKLFEYNIQDCKVTMQLAMVSSILPLIQSLCTVVAAPVIDIDRFASGTFACTNVASYCLKNNIRMDWSPCTQYIAYQGAHVTSPVLGLHEDVWCCDFSSMYPTIMVSANTSFENCKISRSKKVSGAIWKTSKGTHFVQDKLRYTFDQSTPAILPQVVGTQVAQRKAIKKTDPIKANALKTSANSIYGGTGDKNCRIYAPPVAFSITSGGRWCKALSEGVVHCLGYSLKYGDTDSVHISSRSNTQKPKTDPYTAMNILSKIFEYTPFPGMSMEVESKYEKIAYFGKKTYFAKIADTILPDGTVISGGIISKGMSKSRKDRIGLCRTLSSFVIDEILLDTSLETKQTTIGNMISAMVDAAIYNNLVLGDVSKIVKRSGQNYYEYTGLSGMKEYKECEMSTGEEIVEYSASRVCDMIVREVKWILAITGIGSIDTVISMSSSI
jgi:DNA polymerase elongation subunit (family B)